MTNCFARAAAIAAGVLGIHGGGRVLFKYVRIQEDAK